MSETFPRARPRAVAVATPSRRRALSALSALGLALQPIGLRQALAQARPPRQLRILVGYAAGGAVDTLARLLGAALARELGETLDVEDRPGGGSILAVKLLMQSRADGHTLLLAANALAADASLYNPPPYDLARDIEAVAMIGRVPVVIAVGADSRLRSLQQLLQAAARKPGGLSFASPGIGSTPHLAMLEFEHAAQVSLRHIPYKGGAPAIADTLAGEVDCVAVNALEVVGLARSGRMRVLAVMSAQPSPAFPGVPTVAAAGYAGFTASVWYGLVAPAGTPQAMVRRLNLATRRALRDPQVARRIIGAGGQLDPGTPQQFRELILAQRARYARLIRADGIHNE